MNTVKKVEVVIRAEDKIRQERFAQLPSLSEVLNLHDFEARHPAMLKKYITLTSLLARPLLGW